MKVQVKLLKCLVDNIVVDISFETLGGLCTVAFLESIDRHIKGQHLFKRSVILVGCCFYNLHPSVNVHCTTCSLNLIGLQVKAWCYYESRLLGANHGLISTYALETMVLYIFNIHHKELQTPCQVSVVNQNRCRLQLLPLAVDREAEQYCYGCQVLHKFLESFSQFNWDKYCLSLQGPIGLSSFPSPVGKLLLHVPDLVHLYNMHPNALSMLSCPVFRLGTAC